MNIFGAITSASSAFVSTFKKAYRTSEPLPTWKSLQAFDSFNSYRGRLTRYALYWAFYENTAYDDIHKFAKTFREAYSLYRYTRGVVNPITRLVDLWTAALMGGYLDPLAGDGRGVHSALPILTKNDAVREPIAKLWKDSLWQQHKTMFTRLGVCMGDVGLRVGIDVQEETVTLDVVHPGSIKWVDRDKHGRVKAYILEEFRLDPEFNDAQINPFFDPSGVRQVCVYTESCFLENGEAIIQTYKNGEPYDWDGGGARRSLGFGVVPFVIVHHRRMAPRDLWGWAEPHAGLTKVMESDDLASKLDDQIRKISEGAWFITNAQPPRRGGAPTNGDDRDEMRVIYGGNGGTAVPLILPLDIQFTTLHLDWLTKNFERDYPELRFDSMRVAGDASAKALREVRKSAEARFIDRRVVYDEALVEAQRMAIAIGGEMGFPGYEGFSLGSLEDNSLDHSIGQRTVFEVDTLDKIEEEQAFWTAAGAATTAGMPLDVYLDRMGWSPDQIQQVVDAKERDRQQAIEDMKTQAEVAAAAKAAAQPAGKPAPGGQGGS